MTFTNICNSINGIKSSQDCCSSCAIYEKWSSSFVFVLYNHFFQFICSHPSSAIRIMKLKIFFCFQKKCKIVKQGNLSRESNNRKICHSVEKREIFPHSLEKTFVKTANNLIQYTVWKSRQKQEYTIIIITGKSTFFPSNQRIY